MTDGHPLLEPLRTLHGFIRDRVVDACTRQTTDTLAAVAADGPGDTIYRIDRVSEETLVEGLFDVARREPLCLVAEGLPDATLVLPSGATEADCRWRLLVDPIDGTRGLMYQKRSAWILTGVAPNRGAATRIRDVELAVQTEIPLVKQHQSDQLWAQRGRGMHARRFDRLSGTTRPVALHPSSAQTIADGFATVVRFFPGARDILGAVDEDLVRELLGLAAPGKPSCFEDQYASTGGQLYELIAGHDRFIADLRPLAQGIQEQRGLEPLLCCHPYDMCTALIAEEAGVVLTDASGQPIDAPLDVQTDVAWVGYANDALRRRVEPVLQDVLRRHGLRVANAPVS
jgi:fructose-1,6-bisphosphatase/inositol monophosphatase family enzyme